MLVIVRHFGAQILIVGVVWVLIGSSEGTLHYNNFVLLCRLLAHREEQQAIASLSALESCVPATSILSEELHRRVLGRRQETQLAIYWPSY